jgi:hypothetical protein
VAVGIYLSLLALPILVRVVARHRVGAWKLAVAGFTVFLMLLATARSIRLAFATSLAAAFLLQPWRGWRGTLAVAGVVVVAATGYELLKNDIAQPPVPAAAVVSASPAFFASDGLDEFSGGRRVTGGAGGRAARVLGRPGTHIEIPALSGLTPGRVYAIVFRVRSDGAATTSGALGNTAGIGWGVDFWTVGPFARWQKVRQTLRATAPVERLVLSYDLGKGPLRIDMLSLAPAGRARLDPVTPAPAARGPVSDDPVGRASSTIPSPMAIGQTSTRAATDATGNAENQDWRLAFWKELLRRTAHQPLFGAGFGKPANFVWRGTVYDARVGDAANPFDVTPPHNSFVNMLYRLGAFGFVPFLALVILGLAGAVRCRRAVDEEWGMRIIGVAACFVFTIVIACFNGALEGPYMSVFFWTLLGLLFVIPRVIVSRPGRNPAP